MTINCPVCKNMMYFNETLTEASHVGANTILAQEVFICDRCNKALTVTAHYTLSCYTTEAFETVPEYEPVEDKGTFIENETIFV